MRILFIEGYGDYDAMTIEDTYSVDWLVAHVEANGGKVEFSIDDGELYFDATLSIKEFGVVDEDFIAWITDKFVDYDTTKARNFHVLREDAE